jgi:hypothetical protein
MNATVQERVERQRKMYGRTVEEMQAEMREAVRWQFAYGQRRSQRSAEDAREVIVFSLLSDVQEMIERGLNEEARQALNRAKWMLGSDEAIAAAAGGWQFAASGGERPAVLA